MEGTMNLLRAECQMVVSLSLSSQVTTILQQNLNINQKQALIKYIYNKHGCVISNVINYMYIYGIFSNTKVNFRDDKNIVDILRHKPKSNKTGKIIQAFLINGADEY